MDYYEILGVPKSASEKDLKSAYKKKSMQHHPDRTGGDDSKFKEINEAYQVLGNKEKREMYDTYGTADPQKVGPQGFQDFHFTSDGFQGGININDLMNQFGFGGMGRQQMRNQDITIGCRITISEVYTGKNVIATYRLNNGKEQTVDIKVPVGINQGDKIRYAGMGHQDIQQVPPGDLYVMIQIQNGSEFEVHGVDLHTVRKINTLDLITGTKLDITIPDGKVVSLNIPKGTQPNTVFSIAQRGLPNRRGGKQGNILVKIIGETPRHLDNDDLNAIEQIKSKI